MELRLKKLGDATGLTFPDTFLQAHHWVVGQAVRVKVEADGTLSLQPQETQLRYTAAELNAQCNFEAPMPSDLQAWENAPAVGSEAL